jgi:chemotaxis-related protein WspB
MLMLLFQAENRHYALNSQMVVEVLPWASLYPATGSHSAIVGLLNYHSQLVSVIDLGRLIHHSPSQPNYGTRIILIKAAGMPGFETAQWVGLLADRVVDTLQISPERLETMDDQGSAAAYLGAAIVKDQTIIRCFHPERIDLTAAPGSSPPVITHHVANVS